MIVRTLIDLNLARREIQAAEDLPASHHWDNVETVAFVRIFHGSSHIVPSPYHRNKLSHQATIRQIVNEDLLYRTLMR